MKEIETYETLPTAHHDNIALHLVVVESGLRHFDLGAFVFATEVDTDIIVQNTDESFPHLGQRVAQRIATVERGRHRTIKATLAVAATCESSAGARYLIARKLASHLSHCGGGELLLLAPEIGGRLLRHELLSIADLLLSEAPSNLSFSVRMQPGTNGSDGLHRRFHSASVASRKILNCSRTCS